MTKNEDTASKRLKLVEHEIASLKKQLETLRANTFTKKDITQLEETFSENTQHHIQNNTRHVESLVNTQISTLHNYIKQLGNVQANVNKLPLKQLLDKTPHNEIKTYLNYSLGAFIAVLVVYFILELYRYYNKYAYPGLSEKFFILLIPLGAITGALLIAWLITITQQPHPQRKSLTDKFLNYAEKRMQQKTTPSTPKKGFLDRIIDKLEE